MTQRREIMPRKVQESGRGKGGVLGANNSLQGAPPDRGMSRREPPARVELEGLTTLCKLVANGR